MPTVRRMSKEWTLVPVLSISGHPPQGTWPKNEYRPCHQLMPNVTHVAKEWSPVSVMTDTHRNAHGQRTNTGHNAMMSSQVGKESMHEVECTAVASHGQIRHTVLTQHKTTYTNTCLGPYEVVFTQVLSLCMPRRVNGTKPFRTDCDGE